MLQLNVPLLHSACYILRENEREKLTFKCNLGITATTDMYMNVYMCVYIKLDS